MIEYEGDYSINEYEGIKVGQRFKIDDYTYTIYRIDDRMQKFVLICKQKGFRYLDFKDINVLKEQIK